MDQIFPAPQNPSARTNPARHLVHLVGLALILSLAYVELRDLFSYGQLVTPDVFATFPAVPALDGISIYLYRWNPAYLGSESAQLAGYALLGMPARLGILGSSLEALFVGSLVLLSGLSAWQLAERHVQNTFSALIAPFLYLTSPILFVIMFDASINLVLYSTLPLATLLTLRLCRSPTPRNAVFLGFLVGLAASFEPFSIAFMLPMILAVWIGSTVLAASWNRSVLVLGSLLLALAIAVILNAPFFLGNLGYFTSRGIAGAAEANRPVVASTYGWSSPLNLFSLLGGGLYPRYTAYYPPWSQGLLLFPALIAFVPLISRLRKSDVHFRLSLAILMFASVAWILLTSAAVTYGLLGAIPYLLVFNYPEPLYVNLALVFATLGAVGVDDIACLTRGRGGGRWRPSTKVTARATRLGSGMRTLLRAAQREACVLVVAGLVVASVAPAAFYLETGDFRVLDAPQAIGFPPQWGATTQTAWSEIYQFLQREGAYTSSRALVLPSPAFNGGVTLPGYTINLFNQPEYTGAEYTGPSFTVPSSSEYATAVLNQLIANRTDRIGIPLGLASVQYIFVDKQLDFDGPPRWFWGSLIGSPSSFMHLLNQQKDLVRIWDDSLLRIYRNADFRPYVQAYDGAAAVRVGGTPPAADQTAHVWPYGVSNWSSPMPPSRIASVNRLSDGYLVTGVGGSGNLTIQFRPGTPGGLVGTSSRLDNDGFYISSEIVPVRNQHYVLKYTALYQGPQAASGGYVSLAGLGANDSLLWQTLTCCNGGTANGSFAFPFDPIVTDPSTRFVQVTVVFPYRFGSGTPVTFEVGNLSLLLATPPPPEDVLAPLFLAQLPLDYAPQADVSVLWRDLDNATQASIATGVLPWSRLCLGACGGNATVSWDQLLFAYDALTFADGLHLAHSTPSALAGYDVETSGSETADLALGGSAFRTVYVRASGNGTISLTLGSGTWEPVSVASPGLRWYGWALNGTHTDTDATFNLTGTLAIDAFLLTARTGTPSGPAGGLQMNFSMVQPTEYRGTVSGAPPVILLAQGFSPAWSLAIAGETISPVPAMGWANLFLVSSRLSNGGAAPFTLSFQNQDVHLSLIAVEVGTAVGLVVYALVPGFRRVRRWSGSRHPSAGKAGR